MDRSASDCGVAVPENLSRRRLIAALGGAAAVGLAAAGAASVVEEQPAGASIAPGWKDSVRVATTSSGTLTTAFAAGQTIDGVTLTTGDRILIKNQTTTSQNGIYTVNSSGSPTRATDFDATAEIIGAGVMVEEGHDNAYSVWVCTAARPFTINTTAVTFERMTEPLRIELAASDSPPQVRRRAWTTCSGSNDEQTIQFAIATLYLYGGGEVHLAGGTYNIDSAGVISLLDGVHLKGDTQGATVLDYTPSSGACVTVQGTSDAVRVRYTRISDIFFDGLDSGTTYGIFVQYADNCVFERLRFFRHRGHAIRAVNFTDSQFFSCRFDYCGSNDGSLRAAVRLEGSASWGCDNIAFFGCTWESNEEREFDTVPNGKGIDMLRFVSCKFENNQGVRNGATADTNGRIDLDTCSQVGFTSCFFFVGPLASGAARGAAIIKAHDSCEQLALVGCYLVTGGSGSSSMRALVEVSDALSANLVANSFNIGSATNKPSTACINYTGTSNQRVYRAGNAISFDGTGTAVLEAGTGTLTKRPASRGTATVAAAATSVTVTHNLLSAPTLADLSVTPTATWGSTTKFWVSGITSTQFVINASPAPGGSGLGFAWRAVVPSQD
jgi:hypothetical protein